MNNAFKYNFIKMCECVCVFVCVCFLFISIYVRILSNRGEHFAVSAGKSFSIMLNFKDFSFLSHNIIKPTRYASSNVSTHSTYTQISMYRLPLRLETQFLFLLVAKDP